MRLRFPFHRQTTELNCGPAALQMALEFLGKTCSIEELEELLEIKQGKGISTIKLAIAARKLGFRAEFFSNVLGFNPGNLELDFYKKHGDLTQSSDAEKLLAEAISLGVELHEASLPLAAILDNVREDRVLLILLDWGVIRGLSEYRGHFVPVVGYDADNIYVHNQGFHNTQPYFPISRELFEKARKSAGTDEDIVVIQKKQEKQLNS